MISLLVTLVVLGIIFYFVEQIPMEPIFATGIRVVAIVIVLLLVLQAFGVAVPALR